MNVSSTTARSSAPVSYSTTSLDTAACQFSPPALGGSGSVNSAFSSRLLGRSASLCRQTLTWRCLAPLWRGCIVVPLYAAADDTGDGGDATQRRRVRLSMADLLITNVYVFVP